MSLILDALRKLELERKAKHPGGTDLRPNVLSYRGAPQKAPAGRRTVYAAGALLLVAGVLAVIFMVRDKTLPVTGSAPSEPALIAAPQQLPLSPAPHQQSRSVQSPPAKSRPLSDRPEEAVRDVLPSQGTPVAGVVADNLSISGIAWQDERNLRRAVVNGALLGEGAEVLGARIVEIRENLVRFSRNGQVFEVQYPSAAGR